jgi:glutamate-ammonia-ligase adenylyltransferase
VAYRRGLLGIAVRDLAGGADLAVVAAELADLAAATLEGALAVARAEVVAQGADPAGCRLAVIGMGKCGGRELNYISDVDVVFVAEASAGTEETSALRTAARVAGAMMRICSASSAEGSIWEVDAALRPEGRPARWYARWRATSRTTADGPAPGSSKHCSRPVPSPATSRWERRTSRA